MAYQNPYTEIRREGHPVAIHYFVIQGLLFVDVVFGLQAF